MESMRRDVDGDVPPRPFESAAEQPPVVGVVLDKQYSPHVAAGNHVLEQIGASGALSRNARYRSAMKDVCQAG